MIRIPLSHDQYDAIHSLQRYRSLTPHERDRTEMICLSRRLVTAEGCAASEPVHRSSPTRSDPFQRIAQAEQHLVQAKKTLTEADAWTKLEKAIATFAKSKLELLEELDVARQRKAYYEAKGLTKSADETDHTISRHKHTIFDAVAISL